MLHHSSELTLLGHGFALCTGYRGGGELMDLKIHIRCEVISMNYTDKTLGFSAGDAMWLVFEHHSVLGAFVALHSLL